MQVGSIVKYYHCLGVVTKIVDAVTFPNNTPCKEAVVLFGSGCYSGKTHRIYTHVKQLEVICK